MKALLRQSLGTTVSWENHLDVVICNSIAEFNLSKINGLSAGWTSHKLGWILLAESMAWMRHWLSVHSGCVDQRWNSLASSFLSRLIQSGRNISSIWNGSERMSVFYSLTQMSSLFCFPSSILLLMAFTGNKWNFKITLMIYYDCGFFLAFVIWSVYSGGLQANKWINEWMSEGKKGS